MAISIWLLLSSMLSVNLVRMQDIDLSSNIIPEDPLCISMIHPQMLSTRGWR